MSKTEEICRQFPCAYCGAAPGDRCRSTGTTRNQTAISHGARFRAATEAGLLPLRENDR